MGKAKSWVGVILLFIFVGVGFVYGNDGLDLGSQPVKSVSTEADTVIEDVVTDNLGVLEVYYIDVGQADSILLVEGKQESVILIDTGDWNRTDTVDYLEEQGIERIDILVGTHPHADHIGQMDKVIERFKVEEVWMSGDVTTSQVFERVIKAIDKYDVGYQEPRAWEEYRVGNIKIEVIGPGELTGNSNNGSIAMRVMYGDVAFMFTGDAEIAAEKAMVERGHELKADILKLGHHGSDTSTTEDFLVGVQPDVAIYSASSTNSYGHPGKGTVQRVTDKGIDLYGTDTHGTVVVETNGTDYTIQTEK